MHAPSPLARPELGVGVGSRGSLGVERFLSGQEDDPRRFGAPRPAGERRAPLIGVLEGSPTPRAALSFLPFPNGLQARRTLLWGACRGDPLGSPRDRRGVRTGVGGTDWALTRFGFAGSPPAGAGRAMAGRCKRRRSVADRAAG